MRMLVKGATMSSTADGTGPISERAGGRSIRGLLASVACLSCVLVSLSTAVAARAFTGYPGWAIRSLAQPTDFSPAKNAACEAKQEDECDRYVVIVTNIGSGPTLVGEPVTIADSLPKLVRPVRIIGENTHTGAELTCTTAPLECIGGTVGAGETVIVTIDVSVQASASQGPEANIVSVSGGGAPATQASESTVFSSEPAPFGIQDFSMQAFEADGLPSTQAGRHPYTLLTSLDFNTRNADEYFTPGNAKDVVVDLPPGFVGDPQDTPRCPLSALLENSNATTCPPASRVGMVVFQLAPGPFRASEKQGSTSTSGSETTAIYNMQPEPGYPAEFGFTFQDKPVYLYASAARVGGQLRLRVTVPGIVELDPMSVTLLFFGDPGERNLGSSSSAPFFTNPVDCDAGPLSARAEVDTWQDPASEHGDVYPNVAETTVYPGLMGCEALSWTPSLAVTPETTQADEGSGYVFTLDNPQSESEETPATPELRDATVTLPGGVSISPSAANGLRACQAYGPEGINIGEGQSTVPGSPGAGEDIGDPEATELGAGHPGGDGSPYDDGLYHTAPGHCPAASTIGTVEVLTPLLPSPLQGHVYVAQPGCGGAGQAGCTTEDAQNGTLFGVYLEVAGSGVIVKLAGQVSVDPLTGQITARFDENPQVPFSSLVLRFDGGPGAPLANPQTCGPAVTRADFSAWSEPFTLDARSQPSFEVSGCASGSFAPSFVAGTADSTARAFSSFSLTISRHDREGDLSGVQVTTPPGLLGVLAGVARCAEGQAQTGTCPQASQIGVVHVAVGPGSRPFWTEGRVYLTGPYDGAPFGLSIVVPAQAGPFDLGDVVVRAAITVDPTSGQITVTSGALPQIIDGILLRVRTVDVEVNRPGFMFNPDNCEAKTGQRRFGKRPGLGRAGLFAVSR